MKDDGYIREFVMKRLEGSRSKQEVAYHVVERKAHCTCTLFEFELIEVPVLDPIILVSETK